MARRAPIGGSQQTKDMNKVIGLGAGPDGQPYKFTGMGAMAPSDIVALFKNNTDCPSISAMPTVAKIQWEFTGPISPLGIQKTFGASIDILGSGVNPEGVEVVYQTPGLINGEFQTHILACAVGVHLDPDQYCWTARGNAISTPSLAVTKPNSPDAFTSADITNLAIGNLAQAGFPNNASVFHRARLEYNWPLVHAFWSMVRAYNIRWTYGSLVNVMDQQLIDVAYMPKNSQLGSASDSEQDILRAARQSNDYYRDILNSPQIFLMIDNIRIGSVRAVPNNVGVFRPSDDFQLVPTTYGGGDMRASLCCNDAFYVLTMPYMLQPGVPPGLKLEEQNQTEGDNMRRFLSAADSNDGQGAVPPFFTEDRFVSTGFGATGANNVNLEQTLDGQLVPQQEEAGEVVFKAWHGFMSIDVKGWEIGKSLAAAIEGDANLQAQLCSQCGFKLGWA